MRLFLWISMAAFLGASASMRVGPRPPGGGVREPAAALRELGAGAGGDDAAGVEAGEPSPPGQSIKCGESAIGKPEKPDRAGLILKVVATCTPGKRVRGLPESIPFFGKVNSKCDMTYTKVRFNKTADGSMTYTSEPVSYTNCCGEVIEDRVQVKQLCRP